MMLTRIYSFALAVALCSAPLTGCGDGDTQDYAIKVDDGNEHKHSALTGKHRNVRFRNCIPVSGYKVRVRTYNGNDSDCGIHHSTGSLTSITNDTKAPNCHYKGKNRCFFSVIGSEDTGPCWKVYKKDGGSTQALVIKNADTDPSVEDCPGTAIKYKTTHIVTQVSGNGQQLEVITCWYDSPHPPSCGS